MAGSLPPSSSVTGVKFFTADSAICDDGQLDNKSCQKLLVYTQFCLRAQSQ